MKPIMSGRDRISALPDEILCEILSLLPIKVACTTTILSKRWFSLYYSLTTLHFEDEEEEGRPSKKDEVDDVQPSTKACLQFRRFVDTFMLSKNHHPIKTFHLTCHSKLWGEDIAPLKADEWVEAAKRRGVEDFHIHIQNLLIPPGRHSYDIFFSYIFHGGPRTLNHSMSAIQVAKAIMVKRFGTVRNLKLPPGIFTCKTLVVLKLGGLIVGPDVCSVDLPSLKTLHLTEVYFRARKDLMMLLAGCLVLENLHAPTLNPLQRDCISEFTNLPKLQKADIRVLYVPLTILYNVKILRIDWVELHVENLIKRHRPLFMQIPNHNYYTAIPLFQNLIHIEICCHAYGEVLRFLQHCPNLQILVTEKCFGGSEWYDDKPYPDSAPKCISLHLRTCSIVNYEGKNYSSDFQFGSYVLKNATHLQVMTIYNPTYQDTEQKRQDLEKLHSWCPSAKISLTSCSTRLD